MKRSIAGLLMCLGLIAGHDAGAQTVTTGSSYCSSHTGTLYCLLPILYANAQPNPFSALTAAFASQLTQVPLASPASGIIYTTSRSLAIPFQVGQQSYGPVLTERGDTIQHGDFFAAFTFQHFEFSSLDGVDLTQIPIVFNFCNSTGQCAPIGTINRVDLKVSQLAFFATYGVIKKLDVSVAVPINSVHMAGQGIKCTICSGPTGPDNVQYVFVPNRSSNQATGIGDIVLRAKYQVVSGERFKVAAGTDFRLSTGNELNFLGAGTLGIKPFVAVSRGGLISPHFDLSYQYNGNSLLGGTVAGQRGKLPDHMSYALGIDASLHKRVTVALDILGEHVFSQARIQPITTLSVPDIALTSGSFNTAKGSAGFKYNPMANLLISANALWQFDQNGLRTKPVPLVGISYTFGSRHL